MRAWYRTDVSDEDTDYLGAFSSAIPPETRTGRIVDVDWSERGWVIVTFLVDGDGPVHVT